MKIELPDAEGGNVISIEVLRQSRFYRRLMETCPHHDAIIDTALAQVKCKTCGAELNPMEWVAMMAEEWHRVTRLYQQLNEQKQQTAAKIQELEAKSKVKCQHCGKFTLRRHNSTDISMVVPDGINDVLRICLESSSSNGSIFPMLTYEDGVSATINWMRGGGPNPFQD